MIRSLVLLLPLLAAGPVLAEMRGHGGPVRALAVGSDGRTAISGSFDTSAVLWSLEKGSAERVLRLHEGAVNAVAALPDGRWITAGEEGRIAVWKTDGSMPDTVFEAHRGPVVALAVSPDGRMLASASWDGTARLTPLAGGEGRSLVGHQGNVNGVGFFSDGTVVTGGYDAALRFWSPSGTPSVSVTVASPIYALTISRDVVAAAGSDGIVRFIARDGRLAGEVETQPLPVIALAASPDGRRIAAAHIRGSVSLIDVETRKVTKTLVGPGLPVWSVAFTPDGGGLLTGGGDRIVRRWNSATGEHVGPVVPTVEGDVLAAFKGSRGAEVYRACAACHTLTADGGNRAGPTLHGIFGRRIASVPGYAYSDAFRTMDIVWTRENVRRLFKLGPSVVTPGTKMPEQVVNDPEDLEALLDFIETESR
jgi:cytochrome c